MDRWFIYSYGPPIVQQQFSETEAIHFILNRKIVGFCECSLYVPEDKIADFLELPPLFVREKVERGDLKGNQKLIAENRNALNNGQTTIVSKFAADDIVINTDLLIWYIENGLKVKEIKTIIQFKENLAFSVCSSLFLF